MFKGRLLRVRLGVNPNSSSIGSDVRWLLLGTAAATLLVNLLDAALRVWFRRRGRSDDATG